MKLKDWNTKWQWKFYWKTHRKWRHRICSCLFKSASKTVINSEYGCDKFFREIFCRTDNWINEESGWVIQSLNGEYVSLSNFSPLSWSFYIGLPNSH